MMKRSATDAKSIKPIYVISSPEQFFIDKQINDIKESLVKLVSSEDAVEFESIDAQQSTPEDIINLANTYPFLAEKRCLTVKHFDATFAIKPDKAQKAACDLYESYFDEPADFTVLILIADKLDKRMKLVKSASSRGLLLEFSPPSERDMPGIIKQEVHRQFNKSIDKRAVMLLSELVGTNLDTLQKELEKLDLYTDNETNITDHHVAKMVGNSALVDNFKMTDYLASKNAPEALNLLLQLLNKHQEPPERLLGLLKWQFKRLYNAKKDMESGIPFSTVCTKHKIFSFHKDKFREQINNFSLQQLQQIYYMLYLTDRQLKSTGLKPEFLIENLFCKIVI
ncbi:MAG: DNA polymerase III subunit delta [Candidatus Auribacterota bacterium]